MNYPQQFAAWLEESVNIESLKKDFVAGVDIPAGVAVCMHEDGLIYPYTSLDQDKFVGVTNEYIASRCKCTITLSGYLKVQGSGWQKGVVYYVTNGGTFSNVAGDFQIGVGVSRDGIVIISKGGGGGGGNTIDGGTAASIYLISQIINGGDA